MLPRCKERNSSGISRLTNLILAVPGAPFSKSRILAAFPARKIPMLALAVSKKGKRGLFSKEEIMVHVPGMCKHPKIYKRGLKLREKKPRDLQEAKQFQWEPAWEKLFILKIGGAWK